MSYNGQESGSLETSSALADKKSPMKDVFILDLFAQGSLAPGICRFGRLRRRIGMKNREAYFDECTVSYQPVIVCSFICPGVFVR